MLFGFFDYQYISSNIDDIQTSAMIGMLKNEKYG